MARTVRDTRLDTRAARLRLEPRAKPYLRAIEQGKALLYYRGQRGASWSARLFHDGRYVEQRLATADDVLDADGVEVLDFRQAQEKARAWFEEQARRASGGAVGGAYTVGDALDDYLKDFKRRGRKDTVNTSARIERIRAAMGSVVVEKLTAERIRKWIDDIATSPAMRRTRSGAERQNVKPLNKDDPEAVRRRRSSANRLLTVLKAALNHAYAEGRTRRDDAWSRVKPFENVDAPKIRYLSDAEAKRLVNACPVDFRRLVVAALLTGMRYGEAVALTVSDFDAAGRLVHVRQGKSGARAIHLTDEGVEHFKAAALGKSAGDTLFTRADGTAWGTSHQLRRMAEACKAAKISPAVSFHILRHSYASRLAQRGAPMPVIATQLGHEGTRMTEKHYAHLGPSYTASVVQQLFEPMGVGDKSKVKAIS